VRDGGIDLDALHAMPAEEAHAALVAIKGIGPWTADIYLLACIGHSDAFPSGDLALQEAVRIALKKRKRPTAKQLEKIAEAWRPYRAVAARVLWSYYGAVKRRDAVPIQISK
jgi:DNA-3-methyladenine glycosylase II